MDLDLSLTRTFGRAARPLSGEVVRELTAADLALLETERGIKPSPIKKLRDSHHAVARLVAQGVSGFDISVITGYSQSRVSVLKGDPSFQELIAFYKDRIEELRDRVDTDGYSRYVSIRDTAAEELHDRLLDEPETFSSDRLADITLKFGDRTGLPPATKTASVNVNLDYAAQTAEGRKLAARPSAAAHRAPDQRQIASPAAGQLPEEEK